MIHSMSQPMYFLYFLLVVLVVDGHASTAIEEEMK